MFGTLTCFLISFMKVEGNTSSAFKYIVKWRKKNYDIPYYKSANVTKKYASFFVIKMFQRK